MLLLLLKTLRFLQHSNEKGSVSTGIWIPCKRYVAMLVKETRTRTQKYSCSCSVVILLKIIFQITCRKALLGGQFEL